jgi:hypothetical protein
MNRHRAAPVAALIMSLSILSASAARGQPATTTGGTTTNGAKVTSTPAAAGGGGATPTATTGGAAPSAAAPAPVETPAVPAQVTVPQAEYTSPTSNGIALFINPNVQNLLNDSNLTAQGKARDNLVLAVTPAGAPASPAFHFAYGTALNNAFSAALKNKPTLRQRLNIAIVAAKVAWAAQSATAGNITLQQTIQILVNDPAEPVVLWALRAAQAEIPSLVGVRGPGNKVPQLISDIVPAVMRHPSGPMFEEGYKALAAPSTDVATELLKLWGNRLTQYQAKECPDDPAVDGRPIFELTTAQMWAVLTPQQKAKVMQNISDQLSVAAQWADQKTSTGDKRDQLVKLVQQCAGGCYVIGKNLNLPALVTAATPATNLKVETTPASMSMNTNYGQGLVSAIRAAFPDVKEPPTVGPEPGTLSQPDPAADPGKSGVAKQP